MSKLSRTTSRTIIQAILGSADNNHFRHEVTFTIPDTTLNSLPQSADELPTDFDLVHDGTQEATTYALHYISHITPLPSAVNANDQPLCMLLERGGQYYLGFVSIHRRIEESVIGRIVWDPELTFNPITTPA